MSSSHYVYQTLASLGSCMMINYCPFTVFVVNGYMYRHPVQIQAACYHNRWRISIATYATCPVKLCYIFDIVDQFDISSHLSHCVVFFYRTGLILRALLPCSSHQYGYCQNHLVTQTQNEKREHVSVHGFAVVKLIVLMTIAILTRWCW